MTKRAVLWMSLLVMLALVPALSVSAQSTIEGVCLVTNDQGRINDGTFNTFAYEGLKKAADELGLESDYIETTAATDFDKNINLCISEGYDLVVTVGFQLTDATIKAAGENPDVRFIGVDQFIGTPAPNLVGIQAREDQAAFVVGVIAALTTESNIIGTVYGIDIPPVVRFRNGFEQGAKSVKPDVTILGTYIPSFTDPATGASTALQFIGEGADVVFGGGGPTGSGAIVAAAQAGVKVIGVDLDEYTTTFGNGSTPDAENIITSALKRIDVGVYDLIKLSVDGGDFPANSLYVLSAANGGVGFAPAHDSGLPETTTAQAQATLDGLKNGTIVTGVDPIGGQLLGNVVEVATAAGGFSTLLAAVDAAGLTDTLSSGGPYTIFAPTDAAFEAAFAALNITPEALLADTELLTKILTYHVVGGVAATSDTVVTLPEVMTLANQPIAISIVDGAVKLNDSITVTAVDIPFSNGVIHVIDGVLLPPE